MIHKVALYIWLMANQMYSISFLFWDSVFPKMHFSNLTLNRVQALDMFILVALHSWKWWIIISCFYVTKGTQRMQMFLSGLFFSFLKKCHSGDIKCYSGAPNCNIHPRSGYTVWFSSTIRQFHLIFFLISKLSGNFIQFFWHFL
jgi:hypothetical protein